MPADRFGTTEVMIGDLDGVIYTDGTTQYICKARAGTALATASWQIRRVSVPSAGVQLIRFAGGSTEFKYAATDLSTVSALFA